MAEVRDPVCGMMVDPQHAVESHVGGTVHYFCSENCRQQYEADPARYAAESAAGHTDVERHEPPRTTKGKITAPKFGSAGSGGAEFELGPEQHDRES